MKVIVKKKNKRFLIAILALILAVLIAGAIVLDMLLQTEGGKDDIKVPEIIEGEAIYNNIAVAYPRIEESQIITIAVRGTEKSYYLQRTETEGDDGKISYGNFRLSYEDENGELKIYEPDILESDPTSDYSSLYAVEGNDGYGMIPKLTYLCTAIGTPYFSERIELSDNEEKRNEQLRLYGLTASNSVSIGFSYIDGGKEKTHVITIGDSMITGYGYYFLVDGRDYVYSVENNDYFRYALADFTTFVKPVITAAGLSMDGAFEPYLTTGFEQWKNTLYDDNKPEEEDGDGVDIVKPGASVTVNAVLKIPNKDKDGGYETGNGKDVTFNLSEISHDEIYKWTASTLAGKPLGILPSGSTLTVTLNDYSAAEELDSAALASGITYEYTVTAIEAVIDENGEHSTPGYAVGSAKYVKVTYSAKCAGEAVSENPLHAVINLTDTPIPESVKNEFSLLTVGELATPLNFSVTYTLENSIERKMIITEIITVLDENGKMLDKVVDGAQVLYRFKYSIDGTEIEAYATGAFLAGEGLQGREKTVYEALKGKSQSKNLRIEIPDGNYEIMHSFVSYEVSDIRYFVVGENIVSFKFQQASERNPYYGESLYQNTTKGKYSMYALNASSCEAVVKVLGGIGDSTSSSLGLSGIETVAVGITPSVMKEKGLYAYRVYFELPRGITTVKSLEDEKVDELINDLDDYTYYSTLGFNLYISEEFRRDGKKYRYVGSDMYDVVALCEAENFEFLKYGFVDFYARRNLMLTDVSNIANIKFDFLMTDIYGSYDNQFQHTTLYSYGGTLNSKNNLTSEELAQATPYDSIVIKVTPEGECIETELSKYLAENGYDQKEETNWATLLDLYDRELDGLDNKGTSQFKELTQIIFYTYYQGFLTEEEQEDLYENGELIMKMSVTLGERNRDGKFEADQLFDYVYEFYRVSDRRVAVRLYRLNKGTGEQVDAVSDFYISTFSFKKIVSAYIGILNKQEINNDISYS